MTVIGQAPQRRRGQHPHQLLQRSEGGEQPGRRAAAQHIPPVHVVILTRRGQRRTVRRRRRRFAAQLYEGLGRCGAFEQGIQFGHCEAQRADDAAVGPSGVGKSSLVFAGAVPRLRQAGWAVADLRPAVGGSPLGALAAALLPLLEPGMTEAARLLEVATLEEALAQRGLAEVADRVARRQGAERLLLVIDQFEELYASEPAVARRFVDLLVEAAAAQQRRPGLAVALRADFLGQALEHAGLAEALADSALMIGRMTRAQLRCAIEGPLPENVAYESGLVERILDDVGDEAGALPLLEFALTLLWERQQDRTLIHAAYEELGGVDGALARYAEQVYRDDLGGLEREARRLFVQLVRPGEATEPTRRVARRGELDEPLWPVAQRLAATRLVVTGVTRPERRRSSWPTRR